MQFAQIDFHNAILTHTHMHTWLYFFNSSYAFLKKAVEKYMVEVEHNRKRLSRINCTDHDDETLLV